MKVAVVTTTYNRKEYLGKLYCSLKHQLFKDFTWIIVDDGSTDNTEAWVSEILNNDCELNCRYFYKKNSGKGSALNYAFEKCPDIDFFLVVDSDDQLIDTAMDSVTKTIELFQSDESVGAIFFQYRNKNGVELSNIVKGAKKNKNIIVENRYEYDYKYKKIDGCIGYYSRTIHKYRYPEFEGENYIGPIVIQMMMAKEYKIAFSPEIIGIADYLEGGLSKSGRKLRLKNPLGMIIYCGLQQSPLNKSVASRMKYAVAAQAYAALCQESKICIVENNIPESYLKRWAFLPGVFLAAIWKWKYLNDNNG